MTKPDATTTVPIRRAIISVSDKAGLVEFARQVQSRGIEIFSTGGTRRELEHAGILAHDIASYTGFPEMMHGRLKTLHPKVFGGILARRDRSDDMDAVGEHAICLFDLVVVNLYPFERTVAQEGVSDEEAIEQIDIGGPSLIRAAAKNHAFTTVVTNPTHYTAVIAELGEHGGISADLRRRLAGEAFQRTSDYDRAIADYFSRTSRQVAQETLTGRWTLHGTLRYGENPHQPASVYREEPPRSNSLLAARQIHGKELSYNNYLDLDAALRIVRGFPQPTVVVIKHTNPCGLASNTAIHIAAERALAGDPLSAFGSILAFNRVVDAATAEILTRPDQFIEAIIAPVFDEDARQILTTRPKWKANVRLLELPDLGPIPCRSSLRQIDGGVLVQETDELDDDFGTWKNVTTVRVDESLLPTLQFAWRAVRHVHSNAIVVARDCAIRGVGAGQMSRVDAVEIALRKAGVAAQGAVMASDAFFPFPDSIAHAANAGIAAIVQPGGSRNDPAVIEACQQLNVPMYFTDRRHFLH